MARRNGSRRSARDQRQLERLQEKGVGVIALGFAFVVGPALISNPVLHNALSALRPLGWVAMLAGVALVGLGQVARRQTTSFEPQRPAKGSWAVYREQSQASSPTDPRIADVAQAEQWNAARQARARSGPVRTRPTEWSAAVFDVIEWRRFEALCERLFGQAGFETKSQSHGADGGIDIWLYWKHQPDEAVSLVQCKCWATRPVKVSEVRALLGSMAARKVRRGVFATTSRFSQDATQFAKENGIHLLDRSGLLDLIGTRTPEQQADLLNVATEGEFWVPTCPSCGVKMVRRTPRSHNPFWGCANFPRCWTRING